MTMSAQLGYDPGNFYVWRVSDAFAIHLSLKVVMQLTAQISREGSESQAGELRGILLGRTIHTPFRATVIEDFKLLTSSEDASVDPAAHPDSDDALFEIACRMPEAGNEQRALGFFRAQRDGNLNMGPRDRETFSELFCETGNIALLIQTPRRGGESEAALFYWQDGEAHPRDFGFGFRFEASQLMSGHPGWRYPNPLDHTRPAATIPGKPVVPQWTPAPASYSRERIQWSRLLPTAALVVIGIGALQLATNSNRTFAAEPTATETTMNSPAPSSETALGLSATPHADELEIRWNRESAAIVASEKGVMKITDAGATQAVPFDHDELLRDGYVAYTPRTNDVSIRLEVTGKDGGTTSESIRAVAVP
jgi:hypothetical protein